MYIHKKAVAVLLGPPICRLSKKLLLDCLDEDLMVYDGSFITIAFPIAADARRSRLMLSGGRNLELPTRQCALDECSSSGNV